MKALVLRLSPWRVIGLASVAAGLCATWIRFTRGLGASTNLSDSFPWGLWVGFDVICGVGLAAGGFTISAIVTILNMEKYRPLARPAVLTAFIGYLLVVGGLLFDLGHPLRIWHPIIMWNPHSVMFEVAWCVTLYTIVLAAEVSAMIFERLRWRLAWRIAHRLTFPLTIAAICLSMLHQSSLGSLFLIVPGRLHELWYTPLLPLLFFVSAIGVGLVMTIVESTLSARALGREIEAGLLKDVARLAVWVLSVYLMIRLSDMIRSGAILALRPDRAGLLFGLEMAFGFVIPILLFSLERVRNNPRILYHAAQMALMGFIINRLNVAITGFEVIRGEIYHPSWSEVAVTLMIVTAGVTGFHLAARFLPVFEADGLAAERERSWVSELGRKASLGLMP